MAKNFLKSSPVVLQFAAADIDASNGVIKNVVMLQSGPAKGHGYHLEAEFVENLINYDKKNLSQSGLKARFGHPAMSDTTMGTQMGYFKNFRYDQDREAGIADLHLLDSADKSPSKPQMKSWMLSMAKEATDFVMSSIVFRSSSFYQYDPESKMKVELDVDRWGDPRPKFRNERIYIGFNEAKGDRHFYTDLVEAGAATDSLFSQQFNQDKFAVQAVEFLQEHPAIHNFLKENPQKLIEFAAKADITLPTQKLSFREQLASLFRSKETDFDTLMSEDTAQQIETQQLRIAELEKANKVFEAQITDLNTQLQTKDTRIAELEAMPAETPLEVAVEPAEVQDKPYYCSVTKEAQAGNFF